MSGPRGMRGFSRAIADIGARHARDRFEPDSVQEMRGYAVVHDEVLVDEEDAPGAFASMLEHVNERYGRALARAEDEADVFVGGEGEDDEGQ